MTRGLHLLCLSLLAAITACRSDRSPAPAEPPAEWVARHAARVRSIDPDDTDFSDLAPLAEATRGARVVLLGEATHGEAPTTLAKTRLVRFFHERMGFDVLVWEAGSWDCAQMDEALHAGAPIDDAIATGIFPIESSGGQLRSLMAYTRETYGTPRPLVHAGLDPQFSGTLRGDGYPAWLLSFFDRAGADRVTREQRAGLARAFSRFPKKAKFGKLTIEQRAEDRAVVASLVAALHAGAAELHAVHGERQVAFVEQTLLNVLSLYDWHAAVRADVSTEIDWRKTTNHAVRDQRAAENLLWLANERERGRKILVWAHNGHIARDVRSVEIPGGQYSYEGYRPMGSLVAEALGEGVYSMAFTALEGGLRDGATRPVPVSAGSVEALLGETGNPYLFLDYRAPARDPRHWLHGKLTARPTGYVDAIADWTRVFDGVFFIRTIGSSAALDEGKRPASARPDP